MAFSLFKRQEKRNQVAAPVVQQQPQQPVQPITPPADGNYVNWMKDMLGPTPAEREAQERKIAENKAKMSGWLGLFQGLGALGDLYYASKGVNPSKPDNTPQAIIEKNAADEKQRLDNLYRNRQAYANMLYNLKRQAGEDERKNKLNDAQIRRYDTLEEMARDKAELEKLKAVRVIKQKDGSLMKFDPVLGTIEPLTEADPLYAQYMQSMINRNNRANTGGRSGGGRGANNGTYGYRTVRHTDPATGDVITTRTPTTGGKEEVRRTPAKQNTAAKGKPAAKKQSKGGKKKVNW